MRRGFLLAAATPETEQQPPQHHSQEQQPRARLGHALHRQLQVGIEAAGRRIRRPGDAGSTFRLVGLKNGEVLLVDHSVAIKVAVDPKRLHLTHVFHHGGQIVAVDDVGKVCVAAHLRIEASRRQSALRDRLRVQGRVEGASSANTYVVWSVFFILAVLEPSDAVSTLSKCQ